MESRTLVTKKYPTRSTLVSIAHCIKFVVCRWVNWAVNERSRLIKTLFVITSIIFSVLADAGESCFYSSKKDDGFITGFDDCGLIEGDTIKLNKAHMDNLSFNRDGHACLTFSLNDLFYLRKNGRSQRVHFHDNGCDHFKEGLARGVVNDQMVFINHHLEVVFNPGFEYLSYYNYGHSIVCDGPFTEVNHGEHTSLTDGKCGLLDRQGNLVVDVKHKIQDRFIFWNYINSNNHCPTPPITSKTSALCHAKRHTSNMLYRTNRWKTYEISQQGDTWLITFVEESGADIEFTLTLNSISAHWDSLHQESHNEALQRISRWTRR